MIKEPASKEWFEKYAKGNALDRKKNPSALTSKEQSEKKARDHAKFAPKGGHDKFVIYKPKRR